MALVPPASSTAPSAAGLSPGSSVSSGGGGAWYATAGTIASFDIQAMAGYAPLAVLAPSSATWTVGSTAWFIPFSIQVAMTIQRIAWLNGAAVSGNVDAGIYNEDGTRITSIGSTAQATIQAVQSVAIGSGSLAAGSYYMALVLDNTTGTIYQFTSPGSFVTRVLGVQTMAAAFPLPATATFANPPNANLPVFGISPQTVI